MSGSVPPEVLLVTGASSDLGIALIRRVSGGAAPPLVLAHYHSGRDRLEALQTELGAARIVLDRGGLLPS